MTCERYLLCSLLLSYNTYYNIRELREGAKERRKARLRKARLTFISICVVGDLYLLVESRENDAKE